MFSNLNWTNVVILLLLALFIFGNRLPQLISDGLRLLRNLRRMAQSATSDLSRELGTDIQLEDLHPKTFVRKHVLSEADQEALLKPLRSVSEDVTEHTRGVRDDLRDVGRRADVATRGLQSPRRSATGTSLGSRVGGSPQERDGTGTTADRSAAGSSPTSATGATPVQRPAFDDIT